MNKKHISLGVFFVVCMGLVLWLARGVGALGAPSSQRYELALGNAAGLVEDNAVRIAGVKVGWIESIQVEHRTAVLILQVHDGVQLHEDAVALVRAKSLLGEKYLQLDPGTEDTPVLLENSRIDQAEATFEMDEVLNALRPILGGDDSLAATLRPVIARLDSLVGAASGEDGGEPVVTREALTAAVDDFRASLAAVRRMTEGNEAQVETLLAKLNHTLDDRRLNRIVGNLDRLLASAARDVPPLLARTDRVLEDLEAFSAQLSVEHGDVVGTTLSEMALAVGNLRALSETLNRVSGDLGPLMNNLALLAERAAGVDEAALRRFLQIDGVKVNLRATKANRKKVRELDSQRP